MLFQISVYFCDYNMDNVIKSFSENDTIIAGAEFAKNLKLGDIVALTGDLGAGKTEFIKGICKYFEVDEFVTSPTFTIINQYNGVIANREFSIFHLDLYRIKKAEELTEIGFDECLNDKDIIKLIEWPENAGNKLVDVDFQVKIDLDDDDVNYREIKISQR